MEYDDNQYDEPDYDEEYLRWANEVAQQVDLLERSIGRSLFRREQAELIEAANNAAENGHEFDVWSAFGNASAGREEYDMATPEGRVRSMAERMEDAKAAEAEAREEEKRDELVASLSDMSDEEEPEE